MYSCISMLGRTQNMSFPLCYRSQLQSQTALLAAAALPPSIPFKLFITQWLNHIQLSCLYGREGSSVESACSRKAVWELQWKRTASLPQHSREMSQEWILYPLITLLSTSSCTAFSLLPFFFPLHLEQSHSASPDSSANPIFLLSLPSASRDAFSFSFCQGNFWSYVFLFFPCRFPPSKFP